MTVSVTSLADLDMAGLLLMFVPVGILLFSYILYRCVKFSRADGDFTVLSKTLKQDYFRGKVVWVTGASSGIGEALCHQLSRCGAKLILSARSEDKLADVRLSLASPDNAKLLVLDLGDPIATKAAFDKAQDLFGNIDILINNAGISTRAAFVDIQEEVVRKVMELNVFAPWILTRAVVPGMISAGFGHIVNISSIAGKVGTPARTAYCASKFAIIGMMDSLRLELEALSGSVHVCNVCPGPVKTQISQNALVGDGSKFNQPTKMIEEGMTAKRCAELILIGVSNQLHEVWTTQQPLLFLAYLSQFSPWLTHKILKARAKGILDETGKVKEE